MNSLNTLGIRIAGITLVLILAVFGIWKGVEMGIAQYQISKTAKLTASPSPSSTPTPYLAPEIPLTPDQNQQVLGFAEKAKETLVGYTEKYIASLPTDIEKTQVLDPKKVEAFVEANKGQLLPDLYAGTVQTTTKTGKNAIEAYLDAISPAQNSAIAGITGEKITSALEKQQSGEDPNALASIHTLLKNNFELFKSVQVPTEAINLHTKLLQATLALSNSVELLQNMKNDVVGGLIGQKNLVDLHSVFTDIEKQIIALKTKYGIK